MSSWTIIFMSKILIVPDIHNKIELADAIIKQESGFDRCIFLGDYWDSLRDTPEDARRTAEWVRSRIFDTRFTFLWGNHDLSYGFDNYSTWCSGFRVDKKSAIRQVLKKEDFNCFSFYIFVEGFLLSHAGLHPRFLPPIWRVKDISPDILEPFLKRETEKCLIELAMSESTHWFYQPGGARWRPRRDDIGAGGLLWCDALYEFCPVPNLSQVFGHTKMGQYPRIFRDNGTSVSDRVCLETEIKESFHWSVALDCQLAYYAVIENGVLRIKTSPTT